MRTARVMVLAVLSCASGALGVRGLVAGSEGSPATPRDAELAQQPEARILRPQSGNAVVVAWNEKAYEIAFAEDQLLTFKGLRAFAMTNIAIHDALNAIEPVYRQYAPIDPDPFAHPIAAAAQAAHDVLLAQYPAEGAVLDALLADWLSRVPDGPRESHGIALGQQSAAAILALREDDGWDFQGSYEFAHELGKYQTTPPWNGFVVQPGFRFARPFGLKAPDQFRPVPPPRLDSRPYAEAYNEVKNYGRVNSPVRTPDQTRYAVWWMEFAEGSVNRLARELVSGQQTHLWVAARMLALLNMSLYDGYTAVWDAKYEHNHWRPYTAIHEAGRDPNPATEPDARWEPLRVTPPHPEYVSAHAAGCKASFEVLRRSFGDQFSFTMKTRTAPPDMPTRSFTSFSAAAAECADSRVRLGWHFRYATDRGIELGRSVSAYVAAHNLELRRDHRE